MIRSAPNGCRVPSRTAFVLACTFACTFAAVLGLSFARPRNASGAVGWEYEIPDGLPPGFRAPGYVEGEVLVQLRSAVPRGKAAAIAQSEGATLAEVVTPEGLIKVRFEGSESVFEATERWKKRSDVLYAVPNVLAHGFFVPNDSTIGRFDLGWNLRQFDAFNAWDVVTGSPDIVVAIVDAGVAYEDYPVPDYEKKGLWPGVTMYRRSPELPGPFLPGWDFVNDDAHANDDNGHGTSVATIAAGAANNRAGSAGIAFGVTILPVKVLNYRNDAQLDDIVQGIRFAAEQGADVINMSLGLPPIRLLRALGYTEPVIADLVKPFRDAVSFAQRRGAILVGASGNFGASEVSYPAGLPGVIAVGATGVDNKPAGYSSYGLRLDFMAPGGDFLDVNGDHIQDAVALLSVKPHRSEGSLCKPDSFNVFFFFGTSGAAPHVTGAVALLRSLGLENQGQIEQILRTTAVNPFRSSKGFDPSYGSGLVQVGKAVRYAAERRKLLAEGVGGGTGSGGGGDGALGARLLSANPARGSTDLEFRVNHDGNALVRVYDARGALVRTLREGAAPAGLSRVHWDGRDDGGASVSNGVYFLRVETTDGTYTRKVAFLR